MKILFCGTPAVALPALRLLAAEHTVLGVLTAPDAPVGRKQILTPPPVKTLALELGLPVFQPTKASSPETLETIRALDPDLIVVVAYGEILSRDFLAIPPHGCLNIHFSLLPLWRGASPVQHAILSGDSKTGVTIQQMVYELDAGPILGQTEVPILPTDTTATLFSSLSEIGAQLLKQVLDNPFTPISQDHAQATFCKKISKTMGELDFTSQTAVEIDRRLRAFTPWPGVYTFWQGQRLKLLEATPTEYNLSIGRVELQDSKLLIGTLSKALEIKTLQLEGKKPASAADFVRGYPDFLNSLLPS